MEKIICKRNLNMASMKVLRVKNSADLSEHNNNFVGGVVLRAPYPGEIYLQSLVGIAICKLNNMVQWNLCCIQRPPCLQRQPSHVGTAEAISASYKDHLLWAHM